MDSLKKLRLDTVEWGFYFVLFVRGGFLVVKFPPYLLTLTQMRKSDRRRYKVARLKNSLLELRESLRAAPPSCPEVVVDVSATPLEEPLDLSAALRRQTRQIIIIASLFAVTFLAQFLVRRYPHGRRSVGGAKPPPSDIFGDLTAVLGKGHFTLPSGWSFESIVSPSSQLIPTNDLFSDSQAQEHEDLEAYASFFYGVRGGLILESGALDGLTFSTSSMFVKRLGWTALHVEANPVNFKKLVKNRPESVNLNTALCEKAADVHFLSQPTSNHKGVDAATAVSGIWEYMPPMTKATWFQGLTDEIVAKQDTIPCRPLTPVLEALGVQRIDFWVLDVEGAELIVLKSMDFSKISVGVIVIELDSQNPEKDAACRDLLNKAGFERVGRRLGWPAVPSEEQEWVSRNNWFMNRNFAPLSDPISSQGIRFI